MKFVRLKPFNGRTHVRKTYMVFGIKFQAEKGWYKVDDDVATYLAGVHQVDHGPDAEFSPKAFDIVDSLEEAEEIDEAEKAKAIRNVPERAERKVRVHTPGGKTMPMEVVSNLGATKRGVPSPLKKEITRGDVPKWAHADRIEGVTGEGLENNDGEFDSQSDEFSEDMAATPTKAKKKKKKKHGAHHRVTSPSTDLDTEEDTGEGHGDESINADED